MKQIIVLETQPVLGVGTGVNVVFWFPVTAGREVPGGGSAFRGATAPELSALATGTVVEETHYREIPTGTTTAQVRNGLIALYNARKAIFDARPNPNQFYGMSWDGSVWT